MNHRLRNIFHLKLKYDHPLLRSDKSEESIGCWIYERSTKKLNNDLIVNLKIGNDTSEVIHCFHALIVRSSEKIYKVRTDY